MPEIEATPAGPQNGATPTPGPTPSLVTGATGFTGIHLVSALAAAGEPVRVLVRSAERARAVLPAGVEIVEGALTDPAAAARAMDGVQVVYHLAAAYREAKHPDEYYHDVNVEGTRTLLEAAKRAGVRRFVHCSTVGVMSHIAEPPADEAHPYQPADIYQRTKAEAEQLAITFAKREGLPVAVARPTAIYGPGDTRLLKMFRMVKRGRFLLLGGGEVYYHMVHVDDLVDGLRLLACHPAAPGEIFILGGERYHTLREIAELIAHATGARPPRLRVPAWPFQLAGTICEAICRPLGIEPPIYRRRVDFFTKSRAFSIAKAQRLLGYRPRIPLRDGIRATAEWYKMRGLLGVAPLLLAA